VLQGLDVKSLGSNQWEVSLLREMLKRDRIINLVPHCNCRRCGTILPLKPQVSKLLEQVVGVENQ
jgi:hypothetical protein